MNTRRESVPFRFVLVIGGLVIILAALAALPVPWNAPLENELADFLFVLRGQRSLDDRFLFVYISAEDVADLGWPLTRDYYGYMTHILSRGGARVIGLYALFDTPDERYPEFDNRLSEFIESSRNVCLPFTFAEMNVAAARLARESSKAPALPAGGQASYPIPPFRAQAAGLGFGNLGDASVIRRAQAVVQTEHGPVLSYGVELARLYAGLTPEIVITPGTLILGSDPGRSLRIPVDGEGRIRLNHFGGAVKVSSMGFLELLQCFEADPDSLDFTGKIVVVDAANPSIPVFRATPLERSLPASLIHMTVAENLIARSWIRETPVFVHWILIVAMAFGVVSVWRLRRMWQASLAAAGILIVYVAAAAVLFDTSDLALPMLYPMTSAVLTWILAGIRPLRSELNRVKEETQRYQGVIAEKQARLEEAEERLADLDARLERELEEKKVLSEESRRLVEENRRVLRELEKQLRDLESYRASRDKTLALQFGEIVYAPGSTMEDVLGLIGKVGSDDISVLILGETGTGKELVARAIHRVSGRKKMPFVAINCGALPDTLLESELFGHEKGSFTGAHSRRRGRFEIADGGTVFLDEITETTPAFQAKLLRVLQDRTFERVGGEASIRVDVRIIAATNRDLKRGVEQGVFREDLYYRLSGFPIAIPPLRDRKQDIPVLASHFLEKHGYASVASFSDRTIDLMKAYAWPGNVRELENAVRRSAILATSDGRSMLRAADLPDEVRTVTLDPVHELAYTSLEDQILSTLRALKFSRSAISQTARILDNRDRGTITEYLRGLCFQALVESDYRIDAAALRIGDTEDALILERIRTKIKDYLHNLNRGESGRRPDDPGSSFRGLPKKYHNYLSEVLKNFSTIE